MYTTYNENGTMNNYAIETEMYAAQYPSPEQMRRYVIQGAGAAALILSTLLIAFVAS